MTRGKSQTTDSFFHLLGLGWGDSSLGAGLLETQIQETDAQLSHWGYADSEDDLSAFHTVNLVGSVWGEAWETDTALPVVGLSAQLPGALSRPQILDVTGSLWHLGSALLPSLPISYPLWAESAPDVLWRAPRGQAVLDRCLPST